MPTGTTTTGSLGDSQPLIIDSARIIREKEGVFQRTCDVQTLAENTGLSWEEVALAALTAEAITETTELDNPQTLSDSLFTITPTISGIHVCITDRVYRRLSKKVISKMGQLKQNAIQRKKDGDYLSIAAAATTTLGGTGQTATQGHVSAAARRITSNTTEPAMGRLFGVFHGFVIKDFEDEVKAPVGTYSMEGKSKEFYEQGFRGEIAGVAIYEAGNITIDGTPNARGMVHAKEAVVMVQGHSPRTETRRRPQTGGGADEVFLYDEYAYGERSAGNWLYGMLHDATAPTS